MRGRYFDVLASNSPARALGPAHRPGRNLVRDVFLDPQMRVWYADWPSVARSTVSALRAAVGAAVQDSVPRGLVAELSAASDTFRDLWARHDVHPTRDEIKLFNHPMVGQFPMRRHVLHIAGGDGQVIIAYRPVAGSAGVGALERLAELTG